MNLGARLKQERQRLGLTQAEFAAAGGIAANALIHYEHGARLPRADFLAALDAVGVDVLYVVTGAKMPTCPPDLKGAEKELVLHLRALSEQDQSAIYRVTESLADSMFVYRKREATAP